MILEYLLQIILIATGLFLFIHTLCSLARKKLTDSISMFWCAMAILFVIAGILLIPFQWRQYITPGALMIVASVFFLLIGGLFYLSLQVSTVVRKTQELAIQISLLNQEHIKVDGCLSSLSGKSRNQIWRTTTFTELNVVQAQEEGASHEKSAVCH